MSINIINTLRNVMIKSPYFEYFYRNVSVIKFKLVNDKELLFIREENNISIEVGNSRNLEPELIVELDGNELYKLEVENIPITKFRISTGPNGQVINPKVETIIQRMFMPPKDKKYPIEDVIDLVYGGFFDFQEPRIAWRSSNKPVYVLKYKRVFNDLDLYITYGFSSPNLSPSELKPEEGKISGHGYELMIFAKEDDKELISEFIDWVKYVDDTENHIYQGQYLEYGEGIKLPNTDIAGFIILNPIGLPSTIPVYDGFAALNMFIGVTEQELKEAKQKDVFEVAKKLNNAGYINYTPKNRKSII